MSSVLQPGLLVLHGSRFELIGPNVVLVTGAGAPFSRREIASGIGACDALRRHGGVAANAA